MICQVRPCQIIKPPMINYDFNKKYIFVPNLVENVSEIGSLFQNSWPFYDRTSWLSVTPFFTHFIAFWALYSRR